MEFHIVLGVIAGILFAAGGIPYALDVIHGKVRPNFASWIGWSVLLAIALVAQIAKGASWSVLLLLAGAISDGAVLLLAIKFGFIKFSAVDKICMGLAAFAVIGWTFTGEPLVALVLSAFAELFVAIPTMLAAFRDPSSQGRSAWILYTIGAGIAVASTTQYDLNNLLYPIILVLTNGIILALSFRKNAATV